MSRTTIAVVDSKRLLAVFGPRDQHLRRIRSALGVGVAARDNAIHIEGDEAARSCCRGYPVLFAWVCSLFKPSIWTYDGFVTGVSDL